MKKSFPRARGDNASSFPRAVGGNPQVAHGRAATLRHSRVLLAGIHKSLTDVRRRFVILACCWRESTSRSRTCGDASSFPRAVGGNGGKEEGRKGGREEEVIPARLWRQRSVIPARCWRESTRPIGIIRQSSTWMPDSPSAPPPQSGGQGNSTRAHLHPLPLRFASGTSCVQCGVTAATVRHSRVPAQRGGNPEAYRHHSSIVNVDARLQHSGMTSSLILHPSSLLPHPSFLTSPE
jgi:hypothetical protein